MRPVWCELHDPELPDVYVVVPLTGQLMRRPKVQQLSALPGESILDRWLGLDPLQQVKEDMLVDLDRILDPPIVRSSLTQQLIGHWIKVCVRLSLSMLPLSVAVCLLQFLVPFRLAQSHDLKNLVSVAAGLFGRRTRDQCLPRAMALQAFLRSCRVASVLRIGVLLPTDEMHAWVEVDGQPLLENPDLLVHYRVALAFEN